MKKITLAILILIVTIATSLFSAVRYKLINRIAIGGEARWDYLTVDDAARRVYISNETQVVVLDADSGSIVGRIPNTLDVHGIALASDAGRGFASNGKAARVTIFDLKTLAVLGQVPTGEKPDAILFDPATSRVFAMNGKSNSSTAIDAATGNVAGTIELGGGPEFGVADGAGNVFVNLEDDNLTLHIDSRALAVKDRWTLDPCKSPSSMAMDRANHRLFIGCRSHVMAVLNSDTGKVVTTLPIGDHVDTTAFDPATGLIFNSTGEGTVDVFHEDSPDTYSPVERIRTRAGSKTMALDLKTHNLYVPAMGPAGMEVLLFAE